LIAIDTNVLVYAHRAGVAQHGAARAAIEAAARDPRGWGIAAPSVAEFWLVVTHPSSAGGPSQPRDARRFLERLVATAGMRVYTPGLTMIARLLALAEDLGVTGARVFDLQIGLVAQDGGATELWTHDRGFRAPPGMTIVDPIRQSVA